MAYRGATAGGDNGHRSYAHAALQVERPSLAPGQLAPLETPRDAVAPRGGWACDGCASAVSGRELQQRAALDPAVCGVCSAHAVTWDRGMGTCGECGCVLDRAAYAPPRALPLPGLTRDTVARAPVFSSYLLDNSASCPSHSRNRQRGQWLAELEILTSPHRARKAAQYRLRGGKYWHRIREQGQGERFERVRRCGLAEHVLEGVHRTTGEVAPARPFEKRCGCWRVCERCLGRRKRRLREDVTRQRALAFEARRWQMSERYTGSEGRWSERLITLTMPHGPSAAEDAATLRKAWPELSRRLLAHMRIDRGVDSKVMPVWVRALEVEPGGTGGHAHLHIWWVGPFVDHAWLRVTFGRILEAMGVQCPQMPRAEAIRRAIDKRTVRWLNTRRGVHGRAEEALPWPVVDVRAARDDGAAGYAQKVGVHLYTVKGHKGAISRVSPVHAAAVYQALEGARAVQWARGWAPQKEPSAYVWRIRLMRENERREWALAGGKPLWSGVERAAELPRSVPTPAERAPPVEQCPLPF